MKKIDLDLDSRDWAIIWDALYGRRSELMRGARPEGSALKRLDDINGIMREIGIGGERAARMFR